MISTWSVLLVSMHSTVSMPPMPSSLMTMVTRPLTSFSMGQLTSRHSPTGTGSLVYATHRMSLSSGSQR